MQYHIQTLVKHLFNKDSFEQVTVQELKQFTDDYPYAAVGQYLYAKKLKDSGSYNHYEQSEQASLYFHNALWLRWQLDRKEEAPVLPIKAEETPQQPGFRIVVQMPKTAPPIISTKPPVQQEEKQAEQPVAEGPETSETPVSEEETSQNIQPVAEQAATPATEETVASEQENGLEVNGDGSLVEQEPVTEEQTPETPPVPEEAGATTDTASAVAIAESSQLAEESAANEAAVNAVSITEEVLTPVAAPEEAAPEVTDNNIEVDDIVPAVEASQETTEEIDEIIPAVEVTPEEAIVVAETAPPVEEQPVEPVTETITKDEPAVITAEATPPVEEGENTIDPPPAAIPEQNVPELELSKSFSFPPAGQDGKTAVDLGEPIFESYHTIDYFASQGIKLMQEELKDKLGKQLKSFTDWLRSMKRIGPIDPSTSIDEVTNQSIQRIAEHSVEEKEVLTEAMAEVWIKQGNTDKAIRVYEKLSLLNPAKSTYFAGRIEQLKAQ